MQLLQKFIQFWTASPLQIHILAYWPLLSFQYRWHSQSPLKSTFRIPMAPCSLRLVTGCIFCHKRKIYEVFTQQGPMYSEVTFFISFFLMPSPSPSSAPPSSPSFSFLMKSVLVIHSQYHINKETGSTCQVHQCSTSLK